MEPILDRHLREAAGNHTIRRVPGTVNITGAVSIEPVSRVGLSSRITYPFESPEVPGHGSAVPSTVERHSAEQILDVKSSATPFTAEVSVGVRVGVTVTVGWITSIST